MRTGPLTGHTGVLVTTLPDSNFSTECQAIVGSLPDAVLACDTEGTVEFLNRAAELLTRHTAGAALGRRLEEVLPLRKEGSGTPVESPVSECLRREESVGPFLATLASSADKSARLLEVSAAPIRESGEPISGVILVARDVTRERELTRQMSHRATHDALTGLVNRDEFERRLARALESAGRSGAQHAMGFLDLDGFKRVNDSCGHLAGDSLLQELSAVLRRRIRGRDTVARLGGDEFGILLEHCTTERATHVAEQVRKDISDHRFVCGTETHQVGASIGIVPLDRHVGTADILRAADMACYEAKRRGGNRVNVGALNGNMMWHAGGQSRSKLHSGFTTASEGEA